MRLHSNPLEDITVLGGSEKWMDAPERKGGIDTMRIIMKDGRIYKEHTLKVILNARYC